MCCSPRGLQSRTSLSEQQQQQIYGESRAHVKCSYNNKIVKNTVIIASLEKLTPNPRTDNNSNRIVI